MTIDTVNSVNGNAEGCVKEERNDTDRSGDVDASDGESGEASSGLGGRGETEDDDDDDEIAGTKASQKKELLEEIDGDAPNDAAGSDSSIGDSVFDGMAHDEETASDANNNPLVESSLPSNKSFDHQVKVLTTNSNSYIYFNQWKRKLSGKSTVTRLRLAFEQLLPRVSDDVIGG